MYDVDTDPAREAVEDLIELLAAYECELSAMAGGASGLEPLQRALGRAIARAALCVPEADAGSFRQSRTRH